MAEIIRFETNVWQEVALKYSDGKHVEGRFGDQYMYSLTDDRIMYVAPIVSEKINALEIQPGELFSICKAEVKGPNGKRSIEWRVQRQEVIPQPAAPTNTPAAGRATVQEITPSNPNTRYDDMAPVLTASIAHVRNGKSNGHPATDSNQPNPAITKLEWALKTAIAACKAAELYGESIGYQIRFDPDHIKAMAITLVIGGRA